MTPEMKQWERTGAKELAEILEKEHAQEMYELITRLTKFLKADFTPKGNCKDFHLDCSSCRVSHLIAYLDWLADQYLEK